MISAIVLSDGACRYKAAGGLKLKFSYSCAAETKNLEQLVTIVGPFLLVGTFLEPPDPCWG